MSIVADFHFENVKQLSSELLFMDKITIEWPRMTVFLPAIKAAIVRFKGKREGCFYVSNLSEHMAQYFFFKQIMNK